jgi:hypothetical protein
MNQKQSNEQRMQQNLKNFNGNINSSSCEEEKEREDIPEEHASDDYSQTYLHKGEEFEESFETGTAFSKRYYYQIGKTEDRYFVVNFSSQNKFKDQIQKIVDSFPVYERLDGRKITAVAKTSRKEDHSNNIFILDKDHINNYEILLPDGKIYPISVFTSGKGSQSENYYSNFRQKMYEYKDVFNTIHFSESDIKILKEKDLSEFIYYFVAYMNEKKIGKKFEDGTDFDKFNMHFNSFFSGILKQDFDYSQLQEKLAAEMTLIVKEKSEFILQIFSEYREYFLGDMK